MALLIGYGRVKRERHHFHIRVHDLFQELRFLLSSGIVIGLILSLVTIGIGLVVPFESIVLIGGVTVLASFLLKMRLLSPAYVIGLAFFGGIFLSTTSIDLAIVENLAIDISDTGLVSIVILLGLLVIAEGVLIRKNGPVHTSPQLMTSKRGFSIGFHISQRLWMIPVFLLVPGQAIPTQFDWWPIFAIGDGQYSLFLVPFGIGFYQRVQGMLPTDLVKFTGRRIIVLGVSVLLLAIVSIWFPFVAIIAVSVAIIGREIISLRQRLTDESLPFYFSKKEFGIIVVGIIPKSPAEKMALQVGEVITKVNGEKIKTAADFYQALQKNRAFCKLDVIDTNGEVRFVQRALYDGEHHELGILFVNEEKKWETEAV